VAADVCDKAGIEGLLERRPHTRLFVVTDDVKGIDKDVSEQLLKDWGDEGVRLVKTGEVAEEGLIESLARAARCAGPHSPPPRPWAGVFGPVPPTRAPAVLPAAHAA